MTDVGDRYRVFQPSDSAEGRDVVFSGQLLGQMIMASDQAAGGTKDVRSIHAVFARATCGEIIGLAMRPQRQQAQIEAAEVQLDPKRSM